MDAVIATKIIEFIFTATGRHSIICNVDGIIVAAKITSRIGSAHAGAQRMLRENLPDAMITMEQEVASGGAMKAGCNLPIVHNGELIGSIGITGDPERTEPMTRLASGLISKELREREMLDSLLNNVAQMDRSITAIASIVERTNSSQMTVTKEVDEVEELIGDSFRDIEKTDEVIDTIQSIASNTQMLGLNASIEAAHAREHGRGFSIVAEAVRKLSVQCSEAAESVKVTQAHLHDSMSRVVAYSKELAANTHEQTKETTAISKMVGELKAVSASLMAMTQG
jgi:septal ring factor EnvC (AmiA/AmiB activator)